MKRVRTLLISTYDLGRQPFGLASPAAWLRRAGLEVACVDTSRDPLTDEQIESADLVAFYLPMHTATRLAAPLIARVRATQPAATLAAYGLYAPLNAAWLREHGVAHVLGAEAEADLLALANSQFPIPAFAKATARLAEAPSARRRPNSQQEPKAWSPKPEASIPRLEFIQPDRSSLPS